ncbi:head-tail joining protein [Marinomonas transparens]|uniref:Uncharacterized protein n=1 Tax=Marinomonas transparens TaxID=2795388 RepID=A0A934N8A8_9GAMM|nr:hypothetical protein [Marinomonas transparens]MBJ7539891.1 hypothetical protein [Marinomonas transparens]
MNLSHRAVLEALKSDVDEEFGQEVIWTSDDGQSEVLTGTFSFVDEEVAAKSKTNKVGQLHVDVVSATFSVEPSACLCKSGDRLDIEGVSYLILPFHQSEFEIVLPLKVTKDKSHSWRNS